MGPKSACKYTSCADNLRNKPSQILLRWKEGQIFSVTDDEMRRWLALREHKAWLWYFRGGGSIIHAQISVS